MFASRSLLSVNLLLRESIRSYVKSKPLFQFQKYKFWHDFSYELKMDARKGRDIDRKKRKSITQTWRAVSTQPICSGGDGARERIQDQMEDVHHAVSSTGSVAKHETSYSVVPNVLIGPDVLIMEGGRVDASLDENAVPSEKHSVSMEIGASLMRFIKGKGGGTQEKIEEETGVKIIFPSSKKEDSITIEGNSAESIAQASEKIQSVIDKAVNSRELDYSHFVSLPLAIHPELVDKLVNFQNTILGVASSDKDKNINSDTDGDTSNEEGEDQDSTAPKVSVEFEVEKTDAQVELNLISDQNSAKTHIVEEIKAEDTDTHIKVNITNIPLVSYRPKESKTSPVETSSSKLIESGIEKSIFIKPKTFHLTVLMLKLWNKERVKTAAEVLQSVSSKILDALDNQPIMIRLKGLDCMRGSLAKARVLYAPVEEIGGEGRLLRACKVITDAFIEAGLVMEKDAQQQLKLHATLMNARHRKRKKRTKKADSFDARGIFDKYGGEAWGEYPIREAHLSQRFAFDENGYYHCCASIPFPENMQLD